MSVRNGNDLSKLSNCSQLTNYFDGNRAGGGVAPTGLAGIIGAPIGGPAIGPIGRIPANTDQML